MQKSRLILVFIVLLLYSCTQKDYNVVVKGTFSNFTEHNIVLNDVEIYSAAPLDTIKTSKDGTFEFKVNIDKTGIYLLKANQKNYITLILHPGDIVTIDANDSKISPNYKVTGSPESSTIQEFEVFIEAEKKKVDDLTREYKQFQKSPDFNTINKDLKAEYESIFEGYKEHAETIIQENQNSLLSLLILNRRFGQRKVFEDHIDFELMKRLDSSLMASNPENKHVIVYHERMITAQQQIDMQNKFKERLAPGKIAPDITLETPSGNEVSLSDYSGKIVLLYYWAAWNAPSRQSNLKLVPVYNKYKEKGFEIFAVSLDNYKEMWEGAIKIDNLNWINASDLMNRNSPAAFLYHITDDIPQYYLLDEKREILMKGDDFDLLITELDKLFAR